MSQRFTLRHVRPATAATWTFALSGLAVMLTSPAHAQHSQAHPPSAAEATSAAGTAASTPSPSDWIDGEIRRIDSAQQRLTLKHAEIRHLDMPGMTMAFRLKPGLLTAEQLAALKVGDQVAFQVQSVQGQFQLTGLKPRSAAPVAE